jgi:uncharacterized protein
MRATIVLALCWFEAAQAIASSGRASDQLNAKAQLTQMGIDVSANQLIDHAAQGDLSTVELLLAAGISPSAKNATRRVTALHNAASQGHMEVLGTLLVAGADINAADWQGATPLVFAAYAGKVEAISLLVAQGALVNSKPTIGITPLNAAVMSGNLDAIKLLIAAGALIEQLDANGNSARAIAKAAKRADILSLLTSAKAGAQ